MTVKEIIAAIQSRVPVAHVSLSLRDGKHRAVIASEEINLERKGATPEEAATRLLDSVIQKQAEASHGSWRDHG